MKKFNEFNRVNEGSDPEQTLMENLFSFFYKKYSVVSIAKVESNFIESASKLVSDGEISEIAYKKFLDSKGIDVKKHKTPISVGRSLSFTPDDECGSSSRRSSSSRSSSCGDSKPSSDCGMGGGYSTSRC